MKKLPSKPSALIKLALKDLYAVEKDKNYRVNMNNWHVPENTTCSVCLAGSVMVKSLGTKISSWTSPGDFDLKISDKLHALNNFREGSIKHGLYFLNVSTKKIENFKDRNFVDYSENKTLFKSQMRRLANDLAKKGL